jgi:hypothetical protein
MTLHRDVQSEGLRKSNALARGGRRSVVAESRPYRQASASSCRVPRPAAQLRLVPARLVPLELRYRLPMAMKQRITLRFAAFAANELAHAGRSPSATSHALARRLIYRLTGRRVACRAMKPRPFAGRNSPAALARGVNAAIGGHAARLQTAPRLRRAIFGVIEALVIGVGSATIVRVGARGAEQDQCQRPCQRGRTSREQG